MWTSSVCASAADGTVETGTIHGGVERASLSGQFGLVLDEHGSGYESTDGGMTWLETTAPAPVDIGAEGARTERGCTARRVRRRR